MSKSNLILVGFMGTGKSYLGSLVAKALLLDFVDLDKVIEENTRESIKSFFKLYGEPAFRNKETNMLKKNLEKKHQVIAVGGGAILRIENRQHMLEKGRVVCLTATIDTLWHRLKNDQSRPLITGKEAKEKLRLLLEERRDIYDSFAWKVSTDNKTAKECVEEICQEWLNPTLSLV